MRRMIKLSQVEWLNNARAKEERINKAYDDIKISANEIISSCDINIAIDENYFIFSGSINIEHGEDEQETAMITITGLPKVSSGILVATNSLGGNGRVYAHSLQNGVELQINEGADREVYFSGMISNRQFSM